MLTAEPIESVSPSCVDPKRREALIVENIKLLWMFVHRLRKDFVVWAGGKDECFSMMLPSLVEAVDIWLDRGESRGLKVTTYIWHHLWHRIGRVTHVEVPLIREPFKRMHKPLNRIRYFFEEDVMAIPEREQEPENPLLERLERAMQELPERHREIVRRRSKGIPDSLADLGQTYGVSGSRIGQIFEQAIDMLRNTLRFA